MLHERHNRPAFLNDTDLKRLITYTVTDGSLSDLHDAITIVKNTGVRPGELTRLRWSDIDIERQQFTCKATSRSTRHVLFTSQSRDHRRAHPGAGIAVTDDDHVRSYGRRGRELHRAVAIRIDAF